ncbi:hypothetical protein B0J11DRAFT_598511 [Dendryphion nanum]|uniref:BTB domain-containing protein n=1 Tax=Dendryphion nanum TaxID=256645 RepID=A0A9P9D331_9PLEO|nr:hypothetical protein B0J11DRAFT_598511 [Dendryphion nanum]
MAEASRQKLLASLQAWVILQSWLAATLSASRSLRTGKYSDLTVTCGQDIYKVHKAIICSRAVFFANAIKFPGKESEEKTVDLPGDEPEIIKLLMQYLYEGEYRPFLRELPSVKTGSNQQTTAHSCRDPNYNCENYGNSRVCDHHLCGYQCTYNCVDFKCNVCMPDRFKLDGTASQLLVHSKMYEIGERYDVQGLKELAKEKFRIACLRIIISQVLASHMELINKEEVTALLLEFNGLAYGLLKEKVARGWK